ncbi:hypothetical protein WOLCODRAFT_146853 [Wolfiporia cocos MD-104 SS10]|uniref:DUF6534 domain-containing protein n=1 Tax=Wolfiporia cocos (strain MD-104) TaxID=742152 RepID=A0A2H3JSR7_WOLCO|nr:hypothetical protein WOLCODRAFT_146853 [Wolfiporia cocos MD-104 SS10]
MAGLDYDSDSSAAKIAGPIRSVCERIDIYHTACPINSPMQREERGEPGRRLEQVVVYGLFLLETVQTILMTHNSFYKLVSRFGDVQNLNKIYLLWVNLLMSGISMRLLISEALSILHLSGSVAGAVAVRMYNSELGRSPMQVKSELVWVGAGLACNFLISATMVYQLWKLWRQSAFLEINSMLIKLIKLMMGSGLAITILGVVELTMYLAFKDSNYYTVPCCVLSKVYCNTFMVLLNNRQIFRKQIAVECPITTPKKFTQVGPAVIVQVHRSVSSFTDATGTTSHRTLNAPHITVIAANVILFGQQGFPA